MLTFLTGVITSMILSFSPQYTPNQLHGYQGETIQRHSQTPGWKSVAAPNEALGGGFKKYRE